MVQNPGKFKIPKILFFLSLVGVVHKVTIQPTAYLPY